VDIDIFGYIDVISTKEHSPEMWQISSEISYIKVMETKHKEMVQ